MILQKSKASASVPFYILGSLLSVLLLVLLFPASAYAQNETPQQLYAKSYTVQDGLSSLEVNAIAETDDHYIWVGTYSGLYLFDGVRFSPVLKDKDVYSVTALFCDDRGFLWIGTNDKGVIRYDPVTKSSRAFTVEDGLGSDSIRVISQDLEGTIYLGTTASLDQIDTQDNISNHIGFSTVSYVRSLCCTGDGRIAGTTNAGIPFYLDHGTVTEFSSAFPAGTFLNTAACSENGDLLLSDDENTIYRVSFETDTVTASVFYRSKDLVSINCICPAGNGSYYLCGDNGLGYLDDQNTYYDLSTDSFSLSIDSVLMDYQGNIWFTSTKQGVIKYSENLFKTLPGNDSEQHVVNCITEVNGRLLIGCDDGLITLNKHSGKPVESPLDDLLAEKRIRNIYEDSRGNLWFSTYSSLGLVCVDPSGTYHYYNESEGNASGSRFRFVKELSDGSILAALSTGLLFIEPNGSTTSLGEKDGLQTTQILDFTEASDGTVLAGSDGGGIYLLRDKKVISCIGKSDGLETLVVLKIVPCRNGYLYVTSNALYYDNGSKIQRLNSFPYNNNYDIYITEDDQAWISSSAGLYVLSLDDLLTDEANYPYELMNEYHGFTGSLTSNAWNYVDENGTLFLCCSTGAASISIPLANAAEHEDIKVDIRAVKADDILLEPDEDGTYIIPQNTRRLTVSPAVLNYKLTNPIINISLQGFDDTGVSFSQMNLSTVDFTNIPQGKYTIHMEVRSEKERALIRQASVSVIKKASFYETPYFFGSVVLLCCALITMIILIIQRMKTLAAISRHVAEVEAAREEAEQANNAKNLFLAKISHELLTPINSILGMNELISRECNSAHIRSYAADIESAGNTLLSLITDILDLSKLRSGRAELREQEYASAELFREVYTLLRVRGSEKGLHVTGEFDEQIPAVLYGDSQKLKEVILNLLSNALKYTEKGSITLSVSMDSSIEETSPLIPLTISVKDTGTGIDPAVQDNLFDAFTRFHENELPHAPGTGLGLNICSELLQLMNSSIEVQSTPGEGSEFRFTVFQQRRSSEPMGCIESNGITWEAYQSTYVNPGASILVVDDTHLNLKLVTQLLKPTQAAVATADGGTAAIELAKTNHYDLILMDHMMPDVDGVTVLHWIREHENKCRTTPIVVLTANAVMGAKAEYLEMGFDDYLAKPVRGKELEEILCKFIPVTKSIDHDLGLTYCTDEEFYQEVLSAFYDENTDRLPRLREAIETGDWDYYECIVHSMKSTSMMIGAAPFSKLAARHQEAALKQDYEFLKNNAPALIRELESLLSLIKAIKIDPETDA